MYTLIQYIDTSAYTYTLYVQIYLYLNRVIVELQSGILLCALNLILTE